MTDSDPVGSFDESYFWIMLSSPLILRYFLVLLPTYLFCLEVSYVSLYALFIAVIFFNLYLRVGV